MSKSKSVKERLWSNVDIGPPDACWEYQGSRQRFGYGRLQVSGVRHLTHRLAYELVNGPIPKGQEVLHRCDNPPCCNPSHLFLGSKADNCKDRAAKHRTASGDSHGRRLHPEAYEGTKGDGHWTRKHPEKMDVIRGDNHWTRKHPERVPNGAGAGSSFTADQVTEIRHRYADGGTTLPKLAREYGVGTSTIHRIIKRKVWAHVP
jgi:hypothetical protein